MMKRKQVARLSVPIGNEPPQEFRVFKSGTVATTKGTFLFDDEAAASVMAAYEAHGPEVMIDLEHGSLEPASADPTSRDARGWCQLEIRDGELWATNVRWTDDGNARLSEKRQRFISPAFETDKDGRIVAVINIALTALPATHQAPALIAAAARGETIMDPKLVQKALDALIDNDTETAADILKQLIAAAASGDAPAADPDANTEDAPPPVGDGGADEATEKEVTAASRTKLLRLTGRHSLGAALAEVEVWKASHMKLATETMRLETAERRELCCQLIKLGVETPATIWATPAAKTLKAMWFKMSIAELREHVATQASARSGRKPVGGPLLRPPFGVLRPPMGDQRLTPSEEPGQTITTSVGDVFVSQREIENCKQSGADLNTYAANKARLAKRPEAGAQ